VDDVAFLSWARPTADTPDHIKEGAVTAINSGRVGGYSENAGLPELRLEIVGKLDRDNGIKADAAEIIVTVGAIEGLFDAVLAVVDPGDEVLLPSPTYSTHIRQVVMASGVPVMVPSIEEAGFMLDMQGIRRAITGKTKAIMYSSPCNPTGTVHSEEELRELAEIALDNGLVVITDEAYEYFVYDGAKHFSIASIPEMHENVVSCFTFTKTYAMTGWRVGYIHACENMIPEINKAHIPSSICAPVVSQYAALAALRGSQDCVREFGQHYLSARNTMCRRLDALSHAFSYEKPRGSYLMFPRILLEEGRDSAAFCKRLLKEGGVSTTPGKAFGPTGEEAEIEKAFDRIENFIA